MGAQVASPRELETGCGAWMTQLAEMGIDGV
jgi:hypothetical protein